MSAINHKPRRTKNRRAGCLAAFTAALPRYRGMTDKIGLMTSGCMAPEPRAVAEIVERADAIRLEGPKDDLARWSKRHPKGKIELDIAGGGYSSVMRERP